MQTKFQTGSTLKLTIGAIVCVLLLSACGGGGGGGGGGSVSGVETPSKVSIANTN